MKTNPEILRAHAISDRGGYHFGWLNDKTLTLLLGWFERDEFYCELLQDERRMFCLFVAEALETS